MNVYTIQLKSGRTAVIKPLKTVGTRTLVRFIPLHTNKVANRWVDADRIQLRK